jgi:hypothetical protein
MAAEWIVGMASAFAGEQQKHQFMDFSNAESGKEESYLKWYEGQHIHDLLRISGFVAAQFFKLSIRRDTAAALPYDLGNRD